VRALVVSNMLPDAAHPERGSFVRDQVAALRAIEGLHVELFEFAPGPRDLACAALRLRRLRAATGEEASGGARTFDVVHAHFGLSAWPALAVSARVHALTLHGTDLMHPRTRIATAMVLPRIDLLAAVSRALVAEVPGRRARERAQVLPCGVDMERFRSLPRAEARAKLGLDRARPLALFPADTGRSEKRYDRAQAVCAAAGAELLTLGGVAPEQVPLWVNAANCVIVPSEREGFGLAVLEALACEVPVLATPVGIHPEALEGVAGSLCAPFDLERWRGALEPHLADSASVGGELQDGGHAVGAARSRGSSAGRRSAERFSAQRMARRVAEAWRATLQRAG
jgi:glycosyltransferase involved in cell wall biosynthesis